MLTFQCYADEDEVADAPLADSMEGVVQQPQGTAFAASGNIFSICVWVLMFFFDLCLHL